MAKTLKLMEGTNVDSEYKIWNCSSTKAEVVVSGTFDGASVGLQFEDNGSDIDVFDGETILAIDGSGKQAVEINIPYGQQVKTNISSAGSGTSLYVTVLEINN